MRRSAGSAVVVAACALARAVAANAQALDARLDTSVETGSYELDARLDEARRVIDGTLTVTLENRSERPLTELWWHLYPNAFRDAGSLFMRTGGAEHRGHLSGARGSIEVTSLALVEGDDLLARAEGDGAYAGDRTQLRTPLPRPVAPGQRVTVRARFRTVLPYASARMGYVGSFVLAGQWFPKLAKLERDGTFAHFPYHANSEFYADFARYSLTVRVPAGTVVGATGVRTESVRREGSYDVHRYEARAVHDAAFVAWPHFRERTTEANGLRLRVLYPPGVDGVVDRQERAVRFAMERLGEWLGPYPYPELTVVVPPFEADGTAGMEYPTLITTGAVPFAPAWLHDDEHVAIHEAAHQWFYGLVATDEWSWPFLDEGLTEYATGEVLAQMHGRGREFAAVGALAVGTDAAHGAVTGAFGASGPVAQRAANFASLNAYAAQIYSRTTATLRTAEWVAGDGALVRRALSRYARAQRFAHPAPARLYEAFSEEPAGARLVERFLRPALEGDARVSLSVRRVEPGRAEVSREGSPVAGAVPVLVRFVAHDGVSADVRWEPAVANARSWIDAPERVRGRVARVLVDPDARVVLDEDRTDNARTLDASAPASVASMGVRAGALLAWALRLLGP